MSCIVIGPGLGRDDSFKSAFIRILNQSKDLGIYHVMDADSIFHFISNKENVVIKEIIANQKLNYIFTPNHNEFQRFYCSFFDDYDKYLNEEEIILKYFNFDQEIVQFEVDDNLQFFKREIKLSLALGNKIIVKKGLIDIITNGKIVLVVGNKGSLKRCGGIGDILCGIIAAVISLNKNRDYEVMNCIASSCYICKFSAYNAYKKYNFSLTAPNIIEEIHHSIDFLLRDHLSKF